MEKLKNYFLNLPKDKKIKLSIIIILTILVISVFLPTLAKFIYGDPLITGSAWDGTTASSYRSGDGSKEDPYIISNGGELAYLSLKLKDTNYEDTYFEINNNIVLNSGIFKYEDGHIKYILNEDVYFVNPYTNQYYENEEFNGVRSGSINIFPSLDSFKGFIDAKENTIYGLYMTDNDKENLALFNDLNGEVKNLSIKNSLIYGGNISSTLASSAVNSNIENIITDGYVISKAEEKEEIKDININNIYIGATLLETNIDLSNLPSLLINNIVSVNLTGNYTLNNPSETVVKLDDKIITGGMFNIELSDINNLKIETITDVSDLITFSDVKYIIKYNSSHASGVAGVVADSNLNNIVNKTDVYAHEMGAGIIYKAEGETTLSNSYSTGKINSKIYASGITGINDGILNINNTYSLSEIISPYKSAFININSGSVLIKDTFNTLDIPLININNNTLSFQNTFIEGDKITSEGTYTGSINTYQVIDNILYEDLNFNEENWIINNYPETKYDNKSSENVTIYVKDKVYASSVIEKETVYSNTNINFAIDGVNNFTPINKVEYFINDDTSLTPDLNEITWTLYEDVTKISEEGTYEIYFKITDYKDRVSYINTDIFVLDKTDSEISITLKDVLWDELNDEASYFYISKEETFTVHTEDSLSGLDKSYYYVSNTIVDPHQIEEWIEYTSGITINQKGTYVIYAKVTDLSNNIKYINTDHIVYGGYDVTSLTPGYDNYKNYDNNNINSSSSVTLNTTLTGVYFEDLINYKHNLISSINLPNGTEIKLIDLNNKEIYKYTVNENTTFEESCTPLDESCVKKATYKFEDFKNMKDNENYINEDSELNDNFKIIVDFKNSNIEKDYENIKLYIERTKNKDHKISTPDTDIKTFNIYHDKNGSMMLTHTSSAENIILNTESITNINITSNYLFKDNVIDARYETYKTGLNIMLVDSNGNKLNKKYLDYLNIEINNEKILSDNDDIIKYITPNNENEIKITTNEEKLELTKGTYYLKITSIISPDGKNSPASSKEINIPVIVMEDAYEVTHGFNVNLNTNIIDKNEDKITLSIGKLGTFINPSVRISLYEKTNLTAYDQTYTEVDINTFLKEELTNIHNYVYSLDESNDSAKEITLNFNNKLNYRGYKLVFELYDGNTKIDTVKKHFIVR